MFSACQVVVIPPLYTDFLRAFLKKHSGYLLESGKEYVLETRLPSIMKMAGCTDVGELVKKLESDPNGPIAHKLLQEMTINETTFFRDTSPFNQLSTNILPALTADKKDRVISIWCAACSSGQEAYSIAMLIEEERHNYPGWQFQIYGTDLSEDMIARARAGIYTDFEARRGLSDERLARHFDAHTDKWIIKPHLSHNVVFEPMNLLRIKPSIGPFDVVFCRNVLIYFDNPLKTDILTHLRKVTRSGGYLLSGASEVLGKYTDKFQLLSDGTWRNVYKAV